MLDGLFANRIYWCFCFGGWKQRASRWDKKQSVIYSIKCSRQWYRETLAKREGGTENLGGGADLCFYVHFEVGTLCDLNSNCFGRAENPQTFQNVWNSSASARISVLVCLIEFLYRLDLRSFNTGESTNCLEQVGWVGWVWWASGPSVLSVRKRLWAVKCYTSPISRAAKYTLNY